MKTVLCFYNPRFVSLRRRMKGLYAADPTYASFVYELEREKKTW